MTQFKIKRSITDDGTTLNATRNRKTRQLQLCEIEIIPNVKELRSKIIKSAIKTEIMTLTTYPYRCQTPKKGSQTLIIS